MSEYFGRLFKPRRSEPNPIRLPSHSTTAQQELLLTQAYETLEKLRPVLVSRGVRVEELEKVAYGPPAGGNLIVRADLEARDFAVACLRVFGRTTRNGVFKPTVEVDLDRPDFSYLKTLVEMIEQITGEAREVRDTTDFVTVVGQRSFNLVLNFGPATTRNQPEVLKIADFVRSQVQADQETRLLVFLSSGATQEIIPREIGRLF